jgi:imidazolonepropionase-like amidohydrolase
MLFKAMATFCIAALFAVSPAMAQSVLFEGARVIPGDGSPAIEDAAILSEGGIIARIGKKGDIALPAGGTRIDLTGKTAMPAIVSPHVHPGFQRGLSYAAENFTRETVMDDLNRELYFGVSTVQSLGVERGDDITLRLRAESGASGGAFLYTAGRGIGAPNAGPGDPVYADFAYAVTSEDQIRRAVAEQATRNVDIIKIWVDDRGGRAPKLPMPLALAAVDEAHRHGLKIAAHIFYHDDAVALAKGGVNLFAHLVRDREMSDDLIAAMVMNNVYVNPNLGAPERNTHAAAPDWASDPYLMTLLSDTVRPEVVSRIRNSFAGRNQSDAARAQAQYAILKASVAKLAKAGAKIVLGADTGLRDHIFGWAEQKELQLMAEAGMSPSEVIVAATARAAEFMGLSDRGTLTAGKRADILVLDANPLDDIKNTRRIAKLYLAGIEIDRAAIKASLTRELR